MGELADSVLAMPPERFLRDVGIGLFLLAAVIGIMTWAMTRRKWY